MAVETTYISCYRHISHSSAILPAYVLRLHTKSQVGCSERFIHKCGDLTHLISGAMCHFAMGQRQAMRKPGSILAFPRRPKITFSKKKSILINAACTKLSLEAPNVLKTLSTQIQLSLATRHMSMIHQSLKKPHLLFQTWCAMTVIRQQSRVPY